MAGARAARRPNILETEVGRNVSEVLDILQSEHGRISNPGKPLLERLHDVNGGFVLANEGGKPRVHFAIEHRGFAGGAGRLSRAFKAWSSGKGEAGRFGVMGSRVIPSVVHGYPVGDVLELVPSSEVNETLNAITHGITVPDAKLHERYRNDVLKSLSENYGKTIAKKLVDLVLAEKEKN